LFWGQEMHKDFINKVGQIYLSVWIDWNIYLIF